MFPTNGMLDMTSSLKGFHNVFFSVIVFLPLGYLLGVFVQQVRVGILATILIVVVGILTPPYLLESVLQYWTGRPIITSNLVLGMTLMTGMLLLTFLPATIRSTGLLKDAASP
jgi:hypothetical protein